MKAYQLVIFDLDGTLADTSQGIYHSHFTACEAMSIPLTSQSLNGVIGGALMDIYQRRFGLSAEDARRAVDIYRAFYQKQGIYEAQLYRGIPELLRGLHRQNRFAAVATLKREDFARDMLASMGVAADFDCICGMDEKDTLTKAQLIERCMEHTRVARENAVLVGDSRSDADGARLVGVDWIGVTYGFGFHNEADVRECGPAACASSVDALEKLLLG